MIARYWLGVNVRVARPMASGTPSASITRISEIESHAIRSSVSGETRRPSSVSQMPTASPRTVSMLTT